MTLIINGILIGRYQDNDASDHPYLETDWRKAVLGLSIGHVIFTFVITIAFLLQRVPVIINTHERELKKKMKKAHKQMQNPGAPVKREVEPGKRFFRRLWYLLKDRSFQYEVVFFAFSLAGLRAPALYAFHLFDMPAKSAQVQNVLKSVTLNGTSILLTALTGLLLIYIYALFGFFFLRSNFPPEMDCSSLGYCFVNMINYGIRSGGGIGDVLGPVDITSPFFVGRFFFDLLFFITIIIITLNIVFGIILDTFGQLRDEKNKIEEDIMNNCFICSIGSDVFQRRSTGFTHHTRHEHNPWYYFYFFVYLKYKQHDEYTYLEEYVAEKKRRGEIEYFPLGKAICLESFPKSKKSKSDKKAPAAENKDD